MEPPVGLIAAGGRLPGELARSARRLGRRVVAVALHGLAEPDLDRSVDELAWRRLGEFGGILDTFRAAGAREVAMIGKLPKTFLWEQDPAALRPDALAHTLLRRLADRKDDSLLGAVAALFEEEGFRVCSQAEFAPELVAGEGTLGAVEPTAAQLADIAFGWPVAKALGGQDVGQTVVVRGKAVLAVEAVEGTDEAIRRGCALGEPGASVVKVAKPSQDPRFDMPAVGAETVRILAEGRGAAIGVEAGATLLVERAHLVAEADRLGIALVGVRGPDPGPLRGPDPAPGGAP